MRSEKYPDISDWTMDSLEVTTLMTDITYVRGSRR